MQDPYFKRDLCVDRLKDIYRKHGNIIVALDFDDTIFDFHKKGFTFESVVGIVKECQALGFPIVIFTASAKARHPFIVEYCESVGIKPTKINENAFPSPFGNEGKIFYNILLDDRAGLWEAYSQLRCLLNAILFKEITVDKK